MIKHIGVIGGAVAVCLTLRRWQLHWGATHREILREQPGDSLLDWADLKSTRAIAIDATPEQVWPWIVQIGQGRGGFYSFDWVENLLGCQIHSADRVEPQWQHVEAGMQVNLHPTFGLNIALVEPGVALVLHGGVPFGGAASTAGPPFDSTWAFILEKQPDGSSRLLSRERYSYLHPWVALIIEPLSFVSFVMSRKMLRGIKSRAEGTSNQTADQTPAAAEVLGGESPHLPAPMSRRDRAQRPATLMGRGADPGSAG